MTSKLVFSGKLKIPRAKGVATVQKLVLRDNGYPENPDDWMLEGPAQEAPNVVLDQAMAAIYGAHGDAGADLPQTNNTYGQVGVRLVRELGGTAGERAAFSTFALSTDSSAPSAATTVTAGTLSKPPTVSLISSITDRPDYLGDGVSYTETKLEGIIFDTGLLAGITFNKIYGLSYGNVDFGPDTSPALANDAPISELLLPTPITLTDPEKEAIKVSYSIFWPRMSTESLATSGSGVVDCGSGQITVQERDINDNVTAGDTVNWTMKFASQRSGLKISDIYLASRFTAPHISTSVGTTRYGPAVATFQAARDSATCVVTNPTATSKKYEFEQVLSRAGAVNSSRNMKVLGFLWSGSHLSDYEGSPWWIEFDQDFIVDWTQTLEIHAELTIDWS